MLILTRHNGENLKISNNITVKILSIKGNQVKIGIEAPIEIPVSRQEIYSRSIAEQSLKQANTTNDNL